MEPKVSIVIPVYNGADFLDEAIQSALGQTYRNIEVIVVNDGSDDAGATETVARGYGDAILYFQKANGGVASALNYAIGKMSGDYFSWLSHDDLYAKDKVESEVRALSKFADTERHRAVIYSDYAVFSSSLERATPVNLEGVPPENFRYWLTVKNALHGCTLLIPKQAFAETGPFDENLRTTQDFDLWFRMARRFSFRHIPNVLVYARSHAEQGTFKLADKVVAEGNALLSQFTRELTEQELLSSGRGSVSAAYADIAKSLWRRNFVPAARGASELAISSLKGASAGTRAKTTLTLALGPLESQSRRLLRVAISPQMRARLRARLSPSPTNATAKNLDKINLKQRFSQIYHHNIFGGGKSRSGEGSDLVQTAIIRRELPSLLYQIKARSFLDAPCGDWHWMQKTSLGVESYIGVDIVDALIENNRQSFGNAATRFECLNLTDDLLPKVDVIFSRDCLVHLSLADAMRILANFKRSGSKYLITTTFTARSKNTDLAGKDSFWRALNMQAAPFFFPPPLALINEGCTEERGKYEDKCLGLWLLSDIDTSGLDGDK